MLLGLGSSAQQDELLYQETRRLVGAQLQNIVYQEYLPVILGTSFASFGFQPSDSTTAYSPSLDPSILNEFATVAFRFGHSTVRDRFNVWPLRFHFLQDQDTFVVGNCDGAGPGSCWVKELTELAGEPSLQYNTLLPDALRNHLFSPPDSLPDDLAARNLQRGREHGIPSYNALRQECGLTALGTSTTSGTNPPAPPEIEQATWDRLMVVYQNSQVCQFCGDSEAIGSLQLSHGVVELRKLYH